jgi:hypothetical protein
MLSREHSYSALCNGGMIEVGNKLEEQLFGNWRLHSAAV